MSPTVLDTVPSSTELLTTPLMSIILSASDEIVDFLHDYGGFFINYDHDNYIQLTPAIINFIRYMYGVFVRDIDPTLELEDEVSPFNPNGVHPHLVAELLDLEPYEYFKDTYLEIEKLVTKYPYHMYGLSIGAGNNYQLPVHLEFSIGCDFRIYEWTIAKEAIRDEKRMRDYG